MHTVSPLRCAALTCEECLSRLSIHQAIRSLGAPPATGVVSVSLTVNGAGSAPRRVVDLVAATRLAVFTWVSRGLFPHHKLTLTAQLVLSLLRNNVDGLGVAVAYSAKAEELLLKGRDVVVRLHLWFSSQTLCSPRLIRIRRAPLSSVCCL